MLAKNETPAMGLASQIAHCIEHCHVGSAHRRITDPSKECHGGHKHALTCNLRRCQADISTQAQKAGKALLSFQ